MHIPLNQNHFLKNRHKWLSSLAFLAALTGCGGGGGDASGGQVSGGGETASGGQASGGGSGSSGSVDSTTPGNSSAGGSSSTPDSTESAPTVVVAQNPFNCATGAITCIEVASTSTQTQASLPVTFGQPFKAGDWKYATQGLIAKVDGVEIPLQADEISSHSDGSTRFAVLSAQLNNVQSGQVRIINLFSGTKASSTPNVPADPSWNMELEAQIYDASGNVTAILVAQPQAQLKTQIANNTGHRLTGAVANEYTVVTQFKDKASGVIHPHLTARLHTRLVDNGARIRTDAVLENSRTFVASPANITYDLKIKRDGVVIYSQPKFTHYHHARWHKVVWTGTAPQYRLRQNMPYFINSRSTWNYDLNLRVPESVLAKEASNLAATNTAPMGPAMLQTYFPQTGGRWDIGPAPRWTALYLVSQDDRARASMMANADAAAGVPVHYRDEKTDQPLSVDSYPTVSLMDGTSNPVVPVSKDTTVWTPDTPHQASFAYMPYLISGDAFYLDEMMFWTAWNIAVVDPAYRKNAQGLVRWGQLRGQAWVLRSIWEAQAALPDNHAMKSYFKTKLANNLADYVDFFKASNAAISPLGAMTTELTLDGNSASPWQNDFMAIVLGLMVENGETQAKTVLDWISPFTVGRYNKESEGFCATQAPATYWEVKDTSGKFITSWKDLYARNYPSTVGKSCATIPILVEAYPDCAFCYAANSRAMMGASANAGISNAASTYTRWKALTPKLESAMTEDPTWAIVPR